MCWAADDNDDDDAKKSHAAAAAGNDVANGNKHHDEVFCEFFLFCTVCESRRLYCRYSKMKIENRKYRIYNEMHLHDLNHLIGQEFLFVCFLFCY